MKEIAAVILMVVVAFGVTYLISAGIAWLFIWAFELTYSTWVVAFPVWIVWLIIDKLRPKREKTIQEKWEEL